MPVLVESLVGELAFESRDRFAEKPSGLAALVQTDCGAGEQMERAHPLHPAEGGLGERGGPLQAILGASVLLPLKV